MDKINAVLFGMTGLGNSAFEVMIKHEKINLQAVFTQKRQTNPFPYYYCDHLYEAALKKEIRCYEGLNINDNYSIDIIRSFLPGLIVVSTFNQIISKEITQIPRYGVINVHPSLLPKYRGTTPTFWALLNKEEETGITVHLIEDEGIDSGRIVNQSKLKIFPQDTDGTLRFRLAELSKTTLHEAIDLVLTMEHSLFPIQNESQATYVRKRTAKDSEIMINQTIDEIVSRIKASSPYPGAYLNYEGNIYKVADAKRINCENALPDCSAKMLYIKTSEGAVAFEIIR